MQTIKTIIIASAISNSTIVYTQCDDNGGYIIDCIKRANDMPIGHPVPPGVYASGGTFILKNAGCLSPNSIFLFHSGYYGDDPEHPTMLADNTQQREMLNQYPRLVEYLDKVGAFNKSYPMTVLNSQTIHELTDIPFCETK